MTHARHPTRMEGIEGRSVGIERTDRRRIPRPPAALAVIRERLGTAPDRVLGDEVGLDEEVVGYWRRKAGIPTWRNTQTLPPSGPVAADHPHAWLLTQGATLAARSERERRMLFDNEEAARAFLEEARWPEGPRCPRCGGLPYVNRRVINGIAILECGAAANCHSRFTVKTATPIAGHIPCRTWLRILWLLATDLRAGTSRWLKGKVGLSAKSAWTALARLKAAQQGADPVVYPPRKQEGAPPTERGMHRRKRARRYLHNGERKTLAEWAASVGLPQGLVAGRVAAGWPLDQALMMPKRDAEGGLEQAEVAVAAKGRRS